MDDESKKFIKETIENAIDKKLDDREKKTASQKRLDELKFDKRSAEDRKKLLDGVFVTEDIKDYMDDLSKKYQPTLIKNIVLGILLCVFCMVPLIICAITLEESLIMGGFGALFAMIAAGVYLIVTSAMTSESYKKIIFLNDYNRFRRYRKY